MDSWHSYPSIYTLGHAAIRDLLVGPVWIEEKIDGSQFSFGIAEEVVSGQEDLGYQRRLYMRSKGATLHPDAPEKMFTEAVETAKRLAPMLTPGWTYRGEYLKKPQHNGRAYDRIPHQHVILFDINSGCEVYLSPDDKRREAERLGLEVVPLLASGVIADIAELRRYLETESILGGQKIEGVVVKPQAYDQFGRDKKALLGKFVSDAYKEVQATAWKTDHQTKKDILDRLSNTFGTQARWHKALQHLRERGDIEDSTRDIGKLMAEIPEDIRRECEADIKEKLFTWAWPHLRRHVTRGVPEFYKRELLKKQCERSEGVAQ